MVKYTLHYFDIRGLAECARLLFHYGNIEFIDDRITKEEWEKRKCESPTGKLPWLDVDDEQIPQSTAIYRFLARKVGLYGKDDLEAAKLDAMAGLYHDFVREIHPYLYVARGMGDGDKEQLYKEKFVPAAEKMFEYIEKAIEKSDSGFLLPSGPSWVDFGIAENFYSLTHITDLKELFPKMVKYQERVYDIPQIRDYVKSRKHFPH